MSMSDSDRTHEAPQAGSPLARYRADLERDGFQYDPAQEQAVEHLQRLFDELLATPHTRSAPASAAKGLKARMSNWLGKREAPEEPAMPSISGLYFWGGVGRGKTYLVDAFFEALPFPEKIRTHFHRFMQRVHNELE